MKVFFEDKEHRYYNEDRIPYISVSGLAKKLEVKKDWDAIKKKYAKKKGLTVAEVQADWDRKKDLGTQAGTAYHFTREQQLLSGEVIYQDIACEKRPCSLRDGIKESQDIKKLQDNTVYPELIIYDHEYRIAGQSDKVFVVNGEISVEDYKTDKAIERKAFSSEWTEPEKLIGPCCHLENCNYNMYSLKMSMYMYMLWKQNKHLKVGKLILEHVQLQRDEDGIPILDENGQPIVLKIERMEVPYRRREVKEIFELYKEGKL